MATQRFYDGQPGPDIRRELNNFEAILDGTVAAAQSASTAATSASEKAQQWADAAPGVEVETGKYSAKHWADRAQTTVTGGLIYRGSHSAASGAYPATPSLGDYYKISVAGTLGGVAYSVGDSIIYNGTGWDKIDSTDAVTSVAGRVGAVVLTKGDVDLADVDNTSDANKPISTATQTALNAKLSDAPSDGKQYARKDAAWAEVVGDVTGPASSVNHSVALFDGTTGKLLKVGGVLGTAAYRSVAATGNASTTQVVMGSDTRLTDARPASDVSAWAKAATKPTYTKSEVGLTNVDNTSDANKPVSTATQTALNAKEGTIASGTTAQYWRGDKTWGDFFTDVRAATLTGLSTATNAVVAATDTVLAAIGKLQAQVSAKFDKTGGDIDGNINITGTARRITGDFSNATVANRLMFQTSTTNGATSLHVVPNGTSTQTQYSLHTDPALTNGPFGDVTLNSSLFRFRTGVSGTGTAVPMMFDVNGAERLRIDPTTGNVLAVSGALGYGVGAGGTVVQSMSKSAAVTLNKPTGQITMDNAALAAGGRVTFVCNNSLVASTDTVVLNLGGGSANPDDYLIRARVFSGGFTVSVINQGASGLSEAPVLNFTIIKGATS